MKFFTTLLLTAIFCLSSSTILMAKPSSSKTLTSKVQKQNVKVNLNKADAKEIASVLKGIGLKKAQAIVAYRKKNGSFKAVEELASVKGVGVATVAKNHQKISLK